ncbi:MAG: MBL fold metallo-hydrolase [Myxococcales bacterium]|nr:MBL fold metallo-hydrolase [Myxococcales bacterium]MCB9750531.1 MBL fold metallo-hydrolase [Myxococcales bacterium]
MATHELADGVRVLGLRTPTLPPATATNTLVVGRRRLAVIEPATPYDEERRSLDALLERLVAAGGEVVAILLTHHHMDHTGYAAELRARTGAPIFAHPETAARLDFAVDERLDGGETLELDDGLALDAVFTPGHAPGHLVYRERRTGLVYAGDMVAGEGTILIDPEDGGDMRAYLDSLARLEALEPAALVPSHGPTIDQPAACVQRYIAHRLGREQKVMTAIERGAADFDAALALAYDDTPKFLWPLAARSLEAHLIKLERDGQIRRREKVIERLG